MLKPIVLAFVLTCAAPSFVLAQEAPAAATAAPSAPGEEPVEPYVQSNANAGARPINDPEMLAAFHGREGLDRIADGLVDRSLADPTLAPIFEPFDMVRLRRTLKEQFCYLMSAGCDYSGRTMAMSHANMGASSAHFNLMVQHLREAMEQEGVPFMMQNRFLAILAPMHREIVER